MTSHLRPVPPEGARPLEVYDLAALARQGIPPPELLCGGLLYRGGLHSLAGAPDAGKSTLLYHWAIALTRQEERVLLLDEESGPEQVAEKFLALGATPEDLSYVAYVPFPARTWDSSDRTELGRLLERVRPALVGWDSVGAFLARAGRSEDDAGDITEYYSNLFLSVARDHNAAVVILDHITKDEDGGRYARGSGAKLAAVDVAYRLTIKEPFSRAQSGRLKLAVSKDRRGYLHREHALTVEVDDGRIVLTFTAAEPSGDPVGKLPTIKDRVLTVLREAKDEPGAGVLTVEQVCERVNTRYPPPDGARGIGRNKASEALNRLLEGKEADMTEDPGSRGRRYWWAT